MKLVLVITVMLSSSLFADSSSVDYKQLCKVFQDKIIKYEKKMRDDGYAQTTLDSYKERAKIYCSK